MKNTPLPRHLPAALLLALACAASPATHAGPLPAEGGTEQVTVRLVAAERSARPGQALQLGVQQRIAEHWHTYWLNPGDSGLAPSVAWTLPAGASAGPLQWPTPERFQVGPIANYGYAGEVMLLGNVQVPGNLRDGERFEVQARVDWLVCNDICIPQQAVLGLSLPVQGGAAQPGPDAALLRQARARLPEPSPVPLAWQAEAGGHTLVMKTTGTTPLPAHDGAYFYAARWGRVAHAEPQVLKNAPGSAWRLELPIGETPPAADEAPAGVLVLSRQGRTVAAYGVGDLDTPTRSAAPSEPRPTATASTSTSTSTSLLLALGLALLGGLVLNLMPCVFPVLTIKALSLLHTAQGSRRAARLHGLAYAAGVLASFAALAGLLAALKAGGDSVGWGFQFQSPAFVLLVALLMLGMGLSLSGVVTLGASVGGVGSSLASRPGLAGSFFTGVLAAVVATPCTAPFMGAAIGYALSQPAPVTLAVFLSLGLGLALPYGLLSVWPALLQRLPRPGAWMERLKQALAFPMYASAAWLAWVLTQQSGTSALAIALGCAVVLAFAAWLHGSTRSISSPRARLASAVAASLLVVLAAVGGPLAVGGADGAPAALSAKHVPEGWEAYSPERLTALRAEGKPVFVNLTADWCITCLVNERVALDQSQVEAAFQASGTVRLKGDWTRRDERITQLLAEHGRSGVPLYLYYPAGTESRPTVLPQLLSPGLVLSTLASTPAPTRAALPAPEKRS